MVLDQTGKNIYEIVKKIFPLNRSLTGDGVRKTIDILSQSLYQCTGLRFKVHEIPSGTKVFDWVVPKEWAISEAFIETENGNRILDFANNNLCVVGYSIPVDKWVDLDELLRIIYTQPDQPSVIPYVTSYYSERYGFCMTEEQKRSLAPGKYHIVIKSKLFDGSLTYADLVIPGDLKKEIIISSYVCHPSMANNECSGPALLTELAKYVKNMEQRKYTYRFILNPETIGSIVYIANNYQLLKNNVIGGIVLSCVGDNNNYSLVHSKYGNTLSDKALLNVLKRRSCFKEYSFLERGSDERQYNSSGVDLPIVGFCRTKYHDFKEYHTSGDDLSFVSAEGFSGSYSAITEWIQIIEKNEKYCMSVCCEPQLGKRGLYPTISKKGSYDNVKAMMDFIAYADGKNDLIDISNIIGVPAVDLISIVDKLIENGLIKPRE